MSPPLLPMPTGPSGSHLPAVLLSLLSAAGGGGLIAAWLRWSAARSSKPAELQTALNTAFSDLTKDLQEERAWLTVRISELERETAELKLQVMERDGRIRGLEQSRDSLLTLLRKSGVAIPGE